LLATAYRRDENDLAAFFELGQAEYWIGQVYRDLNALEAARDALTSYAEITRQLIVLQPQNAEWVLEMAFALSNLGSLQRGLDSNNPERELQLLQSALEYNQIALVLDPANDYYKSELGQSHAFLADAQRDVCDLEGAYRSRDQQITLEREILGQDPDNVGSMRRLAFAYSGFAVVQQYLGLVDGALESYAQALRLMEPVLQDNPSVRHTTRFMLDREHKLAVLLAQSGDTGHALEVMEDLWQRWQAFLQDDAEQDESVRVFVLYLVNRAKMAWQAGDTALAGKLLQEAISQAVGVLDKRPDDRVAGNLLMNAVFTAWQVEEALPGDDVMGHLPDYSANPGRTRACVDAVLAAQQAVMLGDFDRARQYTGYLLDSGYTEMNFMRFCREYALCEGR
jgi:tetratricopeptide (TPR) repeat protein